MSYFDYWLDQGISRCPKVEFQKELQNDYRYDIAGNVSLYDMQESAGVFAALNDWLFEDNQLELQNLIYNQKQIDLKLMARSRYKWDVFCEQYPSLPTATEFFNTLENLRPLFYPLE